MRLKKEEYGTKHFHEIKSAYDSYKMTAAIAILYVLINTIIFLDTIVDMSLLIQFTPIKLAVDAYMVVTNTFSIAIALYFITEVKHLSPEDGIGERIHSEEYEQKKEAKFYFLKEVLVGSVMLISIFITSLHTNAFICITSIFVTAFLFYYGMADVLQRDNYNSPGAKERNKNLS